MATRTTTNGTDELPAMAGKSVPASDKIQLTAYYSLGVITLANLFNYMDRSVISILAESIKADLKLDDAQMGFLLGTAFAVFYSILGLAMGSVADRVNRKKVMAVGVAIWSVMTMLGAAATNFLTLSFARFGVGVGESTTNPCAHSFLSQAFPARTWSAVFGTFISSAFLGGAGAMFVGGLFLQYWDDACSAVPIAGACDLAAWKATLLAVGAPGLLVAMLLMTLREPERDSEVREGAGTFVLKEIVAALPVLSLYAIRRSGGRGAAFQNLRIGGYIAVVAAILALISGDIMQWAALGIGAYAIATWAQRYYLRDRPLYSVTFGDRTFVLAVLSITMVGCITGTVGFWTAPYAMRTFELSPLEFGTSLAVVHTVGAVGGVILGGWITDKWKTRSRKAPVLMATIVLIGLIPTLSLMMFATDYLVFLLGYLLVGILTSLHSGGFHALIQELVLPRMRGSASACQALIAIIVIFGTGPYLAGKVSTLTGSLSAGLMSLLLIVPFALVVLWQLSKLLDDVTPARRLAMAMAAGEPAPLDGEATNA